MKNLILIFLFFFLIIQTIWSQNINLISPNLYTVYFQGENFRVKYEGIRYDDCNFQLLVDSGNTIINLKYHSAGGGGSSWGASFRVPEISSKYCKIKIISKNDSANFDISEEFFEIRFVDNDLFKINDLHLWQNNRMYMSSQFTGGIWSIQGEQDYPVISNDGLIITGYSNDEILGSGSMGIWSSLTPGPINEHDINFDNSKNRIWKARKSLEGIENDTVRQSYQYDYQNWPIEIGAPWIDRNNDNLYSPIYDEIFFPGDEMLYFVANDSDSALSKRLMSSPADLEYQVLMFAYNESELLNDVIFRKYRIINKGNKDIKNAYISIYSFIWLGFGLDDFIGCDTTLQAGFGYNGYFEDHFYPGIIPPAVGYLLLQGPIANGEENDSAFFNWKWEKGLKNLQLSSFSLLNEDSPPHYFPQYGNDDFLIQLRNIQRGLLWDGNEIINPETEIASKFPFTGDPELGIGWLNSVFNGGMGELGFLLNTGPLDINVGDTQEIVCAIVVSQGENNLNSVTKLKEKAALVQQFYYDSLSVLQNVHYGYTPPQNFELMQNYPNPFNSSTKIIYKLPQKAMVTLDVFNILGQKIATLVNEEKEAGNYNLEFNAVGLSSGVYFYRLTLGTDFSSVKKMLLLK